MAKKLIFFMLIVVVMFGVCSPVFATEVTTNEATVQEQQVQQDNDWTIIDVVEIIVIAPLAFLMIYGVSDEIATNGLAHSRFTTIGRLNRTLDNLKK